MRWSVHRDSPDYDIRVFTDRTKEVYLDGQALRRVTAFDTDAGWVTFLTPHPETGQPFTLDGNTIEETTAHGVVEYR